jgi:hypothetical protein
MYEENKMIATPPNTKDLLIFHSGDSVTKFVGSILFWGVRLDIIYEMTSTLEVVRF